MDTRVIQAVSVWKLIIFGLSLRWLLHKIFFLSWRDSPLVGLGFLLIHEDFCGF